jgi:hypothetical protein
MNVRAFSARCISRILGGVRAPSIVVAASLVVLVPRAAAADGERTPMFGFAVVGAETPRTSSDHTELAGATLDLAWWYGRFGLAAEGSALWSVESEGTRVLVAGGSARVRVMEMMVRSLMEPRDVELGLEIQAIVQRAWWHGSPSDLDPVAYGMGVALRIRGGGDPDGSTLLAESRFFFRVTTSRWAAADFDARTTAPMATQERALTFLVGIGAAFGAGTSDYAARFRLHMLQPPTPW